MRLHTFGGLWLAQDDGAPATGLSQPRRLTLLAMVASGGGQGVSRERVLATLWPESDTERARHALAQLVYSLRRSSGGQPLLVGDHQLRLDSASLTSDCGDLLVAAQAGDHPRVADLYRGPFLDGFQLAEASDFDHWLDTERERFRQLVARSLDAVAASSIRWIPGVPRGISRRCWPPDGEHRRCSSRRDMRRWCGRNSTRRPTGRSAT